MGEGAEENERKEALKLWFNNAGGRLGEKNGFPDSGQGKGHQKITLPKRVKSDQKK